ncbi:MAG: hydroxyacid dehydrogenase [Kiritimatiellae bacterium]|nr:hydroxyacid dehydrogenase [Kiritimatiellia bacterium]
MKPPDVFFYEAFAEEAEALRRHIGSSFRAGFTGKTVQESGDPEPPAPLISIRTQSRLPPGWAASVRGLLSRSAGYDHLAAYRGRAERSVPCGYLPEYCARAVAEHAMLLWTALLRRLPRQTAQFGRFERDGLTGSECFNKTLLIVGVGHIGLQTAEIGRALGMRVLGVDLQPRHPSVQYVPFAQGLAQADVILCAMNLTPDNIGFFRYDVLSQARKSAVFVNIARGEMSPSRDLLRLLEEGRLAGVALDVFNQESELAVSLRAGAPGSDDEARATLSLAGRPDALLTPHNAFNTQEAVERKAAQSVRQILHFLRHGTFVWPIPDEAGTPWTDVPPGSPDMV